MPYTRTLRIFNGKLSDPDALKLKLSGIKRDYATGATVLVLAFGEKPSLLE